MRQINANLIFEDRADLPLTSEQAYICQVLLSICIILINLTEVVASSIQYQMGFTILNIHCFSSLEGMFCIF